MSFYLLLGLESKGLGLELYFGLNSLDLGLESIDSGLDLDFFHIEVLSPGFSEIPLKSLAPYSQSDTHWQLRAAQRNHSPGH